MNRRLAPVVAVIVSVAACGGSATPTSPTTTTPVVVSPAGSWSGTISDPISGEGTAQLSLSDQAPNLLSGTWSAMFRNGDSFSGLAFASLFRPNEYGITLSAQPQPPCVSRSGLGGSTPSGFTLINVVVTASRLTAVSGRLSCSGPGFAFGTVNLSKQ